MHIIVPQPVKILNLYLLLVWLCFMAISPCKILYKYIYTYI